jgi:hypothetical protein
LSKKDWRNIGAVTACDWTNRRHQFNSLEEAVRHFDRYIPDLKKGHLGFEQLDRYYRRIFIGGDSHVFYDELGLLIPVWKVQEAYRNLPWATKNRWSHWYYSRFASYDPDKHYRNGTVPGTRRRRWHRGSSSPRLRTQPEIRENDFVNNYDEDCAELHIKSRGRRARRIIPNQWDDKCRSRRGNGWKEYRNNQWR